MADGCNKIRMTVGVFNWKLQFCWTLNYRTTGWLRLEGTSVDHSPNPSAQAAFPRAHHTIMCPVGLWVFPESAQSLWAICAGVQLPSQKRCFSSWPVGTPCLPVCAHCLSFYCWASMRRIWPHPLDTLPSDYCTHRSDPPEPSLLKAQLAQLPQSFLMSLQHFSRSSVDQELQVSLRNPALNPALLMRPQKAGWTGGEKILCQPLTLPSAPRDAISLCC